LLGSKKIIYIQTESLACAIFFEADQNYELDG
jgi:hypothetical protein